MFEKPTTDDSLPVDIREFAKLPTPTNDAPFAQVAWIFDRVISTKSNIATRYNYVSGRNFFIEHLHAIGFTGLYLLKDQWDVFSLLRFREQLDKRIEDGSVQYASYSLVGLFSAIRYVMKYATMRDFAGCNAMLDVSYGSGNAETNVVEAYPDGELSQILDAVARELTTSRKILAGYVPEGLGRDPRITPKKGTKLGFGFGVEANMRWYFENILNCTPVINDDYGKSQHGNFLKSAMSLHGGLHNLYRSWYVSTCFDLDMLMPHVLNLAYLTGLNPGSLAALTLDCYGEKHPATGAPYMRFVKPKVRAELELYLNLLDKDGYTPTVDDSVLLETEDRFLPRKQANQIMRTIEAIRKATAPLRSQLNDEHPLKNRLFIYVSRGRKHHGEIQGINSKKTARWCAWMSEHYGLIGDDGEAINFNIVRFRSTKLTELALQGRDLLEIQLVANHKNVRTTIGYLSRKKLEVEARKVVRDALANIHANRTEFDVPTPCQGSARSPDGSQPIQLYRGLLSDCKNPFDPPKKVRASTSYKAGRACGRFNMCLFCKNVVIFRRNLPTLVAYRDQINVALETNVTNLPSSGFYEDSKAVIDNLLDPLRGEFSEEDIRWANEEATSLNPLIDNAVYRTVA